MKRKEISVIVSQKEIATGIFDIRLRTPMAKEAKPGQFVGVYPKDKSRLLSRPISICEADPGEEILRLVYRAGGAGTKEISAYAQGETLDLLGVLGNGYDVEKMRDKDVILLGGGIGIPPMLYTAQALRGIAKSMVVVLGYADCSLFLREDFDRVTKTVIATMDGSVGTKGTVIDALEAEGITGEVVLACGPMPMLKAVKKYASEHGMEAYISLEERMACGIGACLGCVTRTVETDHHTHVKNTRICTEGPVFDARDVDL